MLGIACSYKVFSEGRARQPTVSGFRGTKHPPGKPMQRRRTNPGHARRTSRPTPTQISTAQILTSGLLGRAAHAGLVEKAVGDKPGVFANVLLDPFGNLRIGLEKILCIFPALAEPLAIVGEPGPGFFDDAGLYAKIDQFAGLGYALAVHDIEFDLFKRRRQLVLHDLDARLISGDFVVVLDRSDPADVEPDRGIKF